MLRARQGDLQVGVYLRFAALTALMTGVLIATGLITFEFFRSGSPPGGIGPSGPVVSAIRSGFLLVTVPLTTIWGTLLLAGFTFLPARLLLRGNRLLSADSPARTGGSAAALPIPDRLVLGALISAPAVVWLAYQFWSWSAELRVVGSHEVVARAGSGFTHTLLVELYLVRVGGSWLLALLLGDLVAKPTVRALERARVYLFEPQPGG